MVKKLKLSDWMEDMRLAFIKHFSSKKTASLKILANINFLCVPSLSIKKKHNVFEISDETVWRKSEQEMMEKHSDSVLVFNSKWPHKITSYLFSHRTNARIKA